MVLSDHLNNPNKTLSMSGVSASQYEGGDKSV